MFLRRFLRREFNSGNVCRFLFFSNSEERVGSRLQLGFVNGHRSNVCQRIDPGQRFRVWRFLFQASNDATQQQSERDSP